MGPSSFTRKTGLAGEVATRKGKDKTKLEERQASQQRISGSNGLEVQEAIEACRMKASEAHGKVGSRRIGGNSTAAFKTGQIP